MTFTLYTDFFLTSLLIGNYKFAIGEEEDTNYANHQTTYYWIIMI